MALIYYTTADGQRYTAGDGAYLVVGYDENLTLITDRTQQDVDRWRELHDKGWALMNDAERTEWLGFMKGRYNHEDLNRVENAVLRVSERLNELGYLHTPLVVKANWTAQDTPYVEDLERYLGNITVIRNSVPLPPGIPAAPTIGETLNYVKANNIEIILLEVDALAKKIPDAWNRSGEIFSGEV